LITLALYEIGGSICEPSRTEKPQQFPYAALG
jgi:hypothetical protein